MSDLAARSDIGLAQKIMNTTYNPSEWEDDIYRRWEESGLFDPDECVRQGVTKKDAAIFSVLMPPPNVTGVLHLGHAMENALMDTAVRYRRMRGERTLYLPGADHAAVATQSRVERNLAEEEGIKNPRETLKRDELLRRIRAYADASKQTIQKQIRAMGSSCDWSRFAYTFDEKRGTAVNTVFKKMYDDGLIYRGKRVVNWSVKGQSTLSDDEIEYTEQSAKFYTFRYSKEFPIAIATTRPETKLGDTAVAVHPNDPRYKRYIGKEYALQVGDTAHPTSITIRIIADTAVDPNFGTGAVGVTPAHSQTDFEIYERHKEIGLRQVIASDGKMLPDTGEAYVGKTTEGAREQFVAWLRENDLLEKEDTISHSVGTSDRFKDVVEVLPMEQWFIAVNKKIPGRNKTLKELMTEAVTVGLGGDGEKKIAIQPDRFTKVYLHWIENLRDWCISRQIWWGHRIPVYYCKRGKFQISNFKFQNTSEKTKTDETRCKNPLVSTIAITKCPHCDGEVEQDPDTLDTWFSSGLWTFSTLGWPDETDDFTRYHPISWIQMGRDILFFWMARMILMTTYTLDTIPFRRVYFHGMLKNKDGKKFSKSLGTGVDPLEIKKKYGADALRISLLSDITPGNDPRFYDEKVEDARNMVNKLWNIGRYVLNIADDADFTRTNADEIPSDADKAVKIPPSLNPQLSTLSSSDAWILSRLNETIGEVTKHLEAYNFSLAVEALRDFTWNDFADWYIETHKVEKNDATLGYVFETLLKLWHPFAPFVTEALWKGGKRQATNGKWFLMVEKWPTANKRQTISNKRQAAEFETLKDIITKIRNIRSVYRIPAAKQLSVTVNDDGTIREQEEVLKRLARISKVAYTNADTPPKKCALAQSGAVKVFVHLKDTVDTEKEATRIRGEINETERYITSLENRLKNKAYLSKAPEEVVQETRAHLEKAKEKLRVSRQCLHTMRTVV